MMHGQKNIKLLTSCPSVCMHENTRLSLDGFFWKLVFEFCSKICRDSSCFIKIWQE